MTRKFITRKLAKKKKSFLVNIIIIINKWPLRQKWNLSLIMKKEKKMNFIRFIRDILWGMRKWPNINKYSKIININKYSIITIKRNPPMFFSTDYFFFNFTKFIWLSIIHYSWRNGERTDGLVVRNGYNETYRTP